MLFALHSHSGESVYACEPWSIEPDIPEEVLADKKAFRTWCKKPTTRHCFFSGFEGLQDSMRVTSKNQVYRCHAFVVDYDAQIPDEYLDNLQETCPVEFMPNWASKTRHSGGVRLVWLIENPVNISSNRVAGSFLKHVAKMLQLDKMLPGFDEAFFDPIKYYEVGLDWRNYHNDPIPDTFVWNWLAESGRRLKWQGEANDGETPDIPMEDLHRQLEKEYPNAWTGPFEEGRRSRRFWDDSAKNETSAILRSGGFQCFSGDMPFVGWRFLLGDAFVDRFEADRMGKVLKDTFYDGRGFWTHTNNGWVNDNLDTFKLTMKTDYNIDSRTPKGATHSELDRTVREVQKNRRVVAALPFVHMKQGPMRLDGEEFLNISNVECLPPASGTLNDWGDDFPWLAKLMDEMYGEHQLPFLLAWWQRFYEGGLNRSPELGKAVFTVGPVGCGKTLMQCNIIAKSVGGHMDSTDYIVDGNNFSGAFVKRPIMSIDDSSPASDRRGHLKYSAKLKKIIANPHQFYNDKYAKAGQITWLGRIMVSLNDDAESLRMLPDLQRSLLDKIIIFKVNPPKAAFPRMREVDEIIDRELPYFLQWLLHWEVPEEIKGENRFGLADCVHPELHRMALESSDEYTFVEILQMFLEDYQVLNDTKDHWLGTASELLSQMKINERVGPICGDLKTVLIGRRLRSLINQGFNVERVNVRTRNVGHNWKIGYDLRPEKPEEENE